MHAVQNNGFRVNLVVTRNQIVHNWNGAVRMRANHCFRTSRFLPREHEGLGVNDFKKEIQSQFKNNEFTICKL
jgi:hypothetical protein